MKAKQNKSLIVSTSKEVKNAVGRGGIRKSRIPYSLALFGAHAYIEAMENPCFECGQCCQHFRVSFYHAEIAGNGTGVVPGDLTTKLTDHLACMKGTEKGGAPCIALRHTKEEGYRCSIYEQRPTPCREFNILNEDGAPNPDCQRLQKVAKQRRLNAP